MNRLVLHGCPSAAIVAMAILSACGVARPVPVAPTVDTGDGGTSSLSAATEAMGVAIDPLRRLVEPASHGYLLRDGGALHDVAVHCVLDDKGAVWCTWGDEPAIRIGGVRPATQLVAGHSFVCALEQHGGVACLLTRTIARSADTVALPFRVRRIAGNEEGVVLEAEDGRVHDCRLPLYANMALRRCDLKAIDAPDADGYVNAGLWQCALNRERAPSCRGMASENSDSVEPIAVPGFPRRVLRLVEGLGDYETGRVICAIGESKELACFRSLRPGAGAFVADVHAIPLPGPVRDLAIGSAYGRVVIEDGRVYQIPMSITRGYPGRAKLFDAVPTPIGEPADSISGGACVRYRSGRVACGASE